MTFIPTSPDVTAYTDLSVYDVDPSTLVQRALINAVQLLPGLQNPPAQGDTAMVVWQGLALIVSELVFAVNRLPGATVQTLLGLFNIKPLPGTPPTVTVTFTLAGSAGFTIPAGTRLQLPTSSGPVTFTTDTGLVIAASQLSGAVTATGATFTSAANSIPVGTAFTVIDSIYYVSQATVAVAVTGGAEPETSQAWLSRGTTQLQALNATLVLPEQFRDYALANGAFRAYVLDDFDATTALPSAGVVSVAVMDQGGGLISPTDKLNMRIAMNTQAAGMLLVRVVDPSVTTVNVTATVMALAGQDPAVVQASVIAALNDYLSTDTWQWGSVVRYDKLIQVLDNVPGVDYTILPLTAPTADIALSGFGPLADAGTITVTVRTPP